MLEISFLGNVEVFAKEGPIFRAEDAQHFSLCPNVELALFAFAVGIFRRIKPAARIGHIADDVFERFFSDSPVKRILRLLIPVQVDPSKQRVVVEHLFKVRHQPSGVD